MVSPAIWSKPWGASWLRHSTTWSSSWSTTLPRTTLVGWSWGFSKRGTSAAQRTADRPPPVTTRSEEHTSELQSRLHLVCRLLLEKKKNKAVTRPNSSTTHQLVPH